MGPMPRASLATSAFLTFSKGQPAAEKSGDQKRSGSKSGSIWRLPQYKGLGHVVWPNHADFYTHHKHRRQQAWHTHGVQKQTLMNVVDNSTLGRQAMAEGKPPRVIHVYAKKHRPLRHAAYGKLGDRVMVAVMGQKKKGIIVGLKQKQLPNVPRFDSNNIVLIEENGNPSGNRITAPLPNVIRPGLAKDSNPKKADYTKLFAIATKWV